MSFTVELVKTTQARLASLRYYHGMIDGVEGVLTETAMSRFKAVHGLRERPYPGKLTLGNLWSPDAKVAPSIDPRVGEPAWLTEARTLLGTREVAGSGNNPTIMGWADNLDQWYPGDDVPWCGLFVAHCMAAGAPDEPQSFNRLGARNWLEYGEPCGPELGAVAVFWRTHKTNSWNGHVAICTGVSDTAIRMIGGNQSDNVTETWISRDRLLGFRKPKGHTLHVAPSARTGALSRSEA